MDTQSADRVIITDVRIPFLSMVILMIKWVLASIPAFIILCILGGIATAIFGGIIAGLGFWSF